MFKLLTVSKAIYLDSPYYDKDARKLREGAPKKIVDNYNKIQKELQAGKKLNKDINTLMNEQVNKYLKMQKEQEEKK